MPIDRQRAREVFRLLQDAIATAGHPEIRDLRSDEGCHPFAMQGQAQNLWLNLAIGTNPPTEDLSDWSEDAPWVELTLQLHRTTERVVTIRLDGSQENFYLLADPMDKGRKLTSGLSDWVKSAQHNNRLYKRLLRKNVLPTFTPLEVVELLAYYIEHYPGD